MDALVGNVGNRARHHRCLRKPAQYLGYVLFWFLGHFHHHPDARFKLHYIAKVGIYSFVSCRCQRSGDSARSTLLYRVTPHRSDRLLRSFYFSWRFMGNSKIRSRRGAIKRKGMTTDNMQNIYFRRMICGRWQACLFWPT